MTDILKIFEKYQVEVEKLKSLASAVNENPMAAMGLLQQLQLPPEALQELMGVVMMNPQALKDFAKSMGVDEATIDNLSSKIPNPKP
ncbi:MAG: DUF2999 family protein [Pseudobacteriovorax sp.]|nr:DUF2999 family protein [Pseudobacteriovorax sp.]